MTETITNTIIKGAIMVIFITIILWILILLLGNYFGYEKRFARSKKTFESALNFHKGRIKELQKRGKSPPILDLLRFCE